MRLESFQGSPVKMRKECAKWRDGDEVIMKGIEWRSREVENVITE